MKYFIKYVDGKPELLLHTDSLAKFMLLKFFAHYVSGSVGTVETIGTDVYNGFKIIEQLVEPIKSVLEAKGFEDVSDDFEAVLLNKYQKETEDSLDAAENLKCIDYVVDSNTFLSSPVKQSWHEDIDAILSKEELEHNTKVMKELDEKAKTDIKNALGTPDAATYFVVFNSFNSVNLYIESSYLDIDAGLVYYLNVNDTAPASAVQFKGRDYSGFSVCDSVYEYFYKYAKEMQLNDLTVVYDFENRTNVVKFMPIEYAKNHYPESFERNVGLYGESANLGSEIKAMLKPECYKSGKPCEHDCNGLCRNSM